MKVEEYFNFLNNLELASLPLEQEESSKAPPVITGSVFFRYEGKFKEEVRVKFRRTPEEFWTPSGLVIAAMGRKLWSRGKTTDYLHILPDYMRMSDAKKPEPLF